MNRPRIYVLGALALVIALGAALGVRLLHAEGHDAPQHPALNLARHTEAAPSARVPAPAALPAGLLEVPYWGSPTAMDGWPVAFRTDLDLLAPLGDGPANAALWLKDFTKAGGPRAAEAEAAMKRRVDGASDLGKVLPPDDPLLEEAEPWADQATMRLYPDILPIRGFQTPIPNLLVSLTVAKSWVSRALADPDAPGALDDCRRAVRWGRLLRQEGVTVIQDLIGLACIRAGAQGIYDLASRRGDGQAALVAAIVLGEHAPQRLRTQQLVTKLSVVDGGGLRITDRKVEELAEAIRTLPDLRFRGEAIVQMAIVRSVGTRDQRERAEEALRGAAETKDPVQAALVRWAQESDFSRRDLLKMAGVE
ncbi:MAG: hypothetical protein ACYDBY_13015 [Thermoanaerobaculia bacterium]